MVEIHPVSAATSAGAPERQHTLEFEFTGSGAEYFRIWIVNLALTITTLGIYSAWAKVRRLRYFHGYTRLDGVPFEYTGDPIAILKGRMIVYGALAAYGILQNFMPLLQFAAMVAIAAGLPWLVVKALRFKARNTRYRGLRFAFHGGYRDALTVFVLLLILVPFTLGLIFPYIAARKNAFIVGNHAFGTSPLTMRATPRQFYAVYLVAIGIVLGLIVASALLTAVTQLSPGGGSGPFFILWVSGFFLGALLAYAYLRASIANLVLNNTRVGPHGFESTLDFKNLFGIYVVNMVLLACTLGLYSPWARVRLAKYYASRTRLIVSGNADQFLAAQLQTVEATGGEFAEALDVDLSL